MTELKKQISVVLETDNNFDELSLVSDLKKFLYNYDVSIVGTHIKTIK
jgi:hypothetical protein